MAKPQRFFTQAEATRSFLELCRTVLQEKRRLYVKDKSGAAYLTLTRTDKKLKGPAVTVSAQQFKDHFSRCSALIKSGVCFKLTLKGTDEFVYARQHTGYKDPLRHIIDEWVRLIYDEAERRRDRGATDAEARLNALKSAMGQPSAPGSFTKVDAPDTPDELAGN